MVEGDDISEQVEKNRKDLKRCKREEEPVLTAYREGATELEQFRSEMKKVNTTEKRVLAEQEALEQIQQELYNQQTQMNEAQDVFGEIRGSIDNLGFWDRQRLIRLLVDVIWISPEGKVELDCVVPFDSLHESSTFFPQQSCPRNCFANTGQGLELF